MKLPGPDHPITVEPTEARVTVHLGDRVIADTTAALGMAEADYPVVQYVPMADVDQQVLRESDTVTSCPYKGDASYYDLVTGDSEQSDAVWVYRDPHAAVASVAGHAAFYPGKVQISIEGRPGVNRRPA